VTQGNLLADERIRCLKIGKTISLNRTRARVVRTPFAQGFEPFVVELEKLVFEVALHELCSPDFYDPRCFASMKSRPAGFEKLVRGPAFLRPFETVGNA